MREETAKISNRPSDQATNRPISRSAKRLTDQLVARPSDQATKRPTERKRVRRSFEFYTDQMETLKQLQIEAVIRGKNFSMSVAIREALDEYFARLSSIKK